MQNLQQRSRTSTSDDSVAEEPAMTSSRTKDVDGGWAWAVLAASSLNVLLASGIAFVSGIFQKLFLEQFQQSVAYTAWVTALFSSFMQLAGPLSGMVTSATNCRVTVMTGGALLAGGLAASSFATSLHYLLVSFGMVGGIGLGLMYTPSIVIVNFFFDRRRTVIMGLALSAGGIGITCTPMLSRFLIDQFNWRETMMILAAIAAHICVFGAIMFPMHEPPSSCLRLCRTLPRLQDPGPSPWAHPDPEGDQPQHVQRSHSPAAEHDGSVLILNPGDVTISDWSVVERAEPPVHEELNGDVGDPAEGLLLPRKTSSTAASVNESEQEETHPNKNNTGEFSSHPRLAPPPRTHHHFGSRNSLNEGILHKMNVLKSLLPSRSADGKLSFSSGNVSSLPRQDHPGWARGLGDTPGRQDSPRGSHRDVRTTASIVSSVYSLHGVGLPVPGDPGTPACDPGQDGEEGDEGDGGGGGGDGGGGGGGCWAVLKNAPFLWLCLNLFLSNMACSTFAIHLPAFSQQRGLSDQDITLVLAMFGLAVFLSRVLVGALGHDDRVDKLAVYFGLFLLVSLVQVAAPWTESLAGVTAFSVLFAAYFGGAYSLLTSLTISLVGLPSLAFAFGVEMVSAGLGYLLGSPLAGWIVDETGDYDYSMYFGGFVMFLSAISVLCLTCCRRPGASPVGYHPQH